MARRHETKGLARHHREASSAGTRKQRKHNLCGGYALAKLVTPPLPEMCPKCGWPKGGRGCEIYCGSPSEDSGNG